MNKDLVSVVIPTYKRSDDLPRAIESVLNQTYSNIEIIVVDDNGNGSEYQLATEKRLKKYIEKGEITYIKHATNKNGSAARNTGIRNSNGTYIALLDDDDYFYKDKIKKQVDYLTLHEEFDAVYCFIRTKGVIANENKQEGNLAVNVLLMNCFLQTSSLLFKKESLVAINGFDESFYRHQDYEMLLRFFRHGYEIGCVNEVLVEYGDNKGLNVPNGEKTEKIKQKYLTTFSDYINELGVGIPGFYTKVYAKHYMQVFLCYLREHKIKDVLRIWFRYLLMRPDVFLELFYKKISFRVKIKSVGKQNFSEQK